MKKFLIPSAFILASACGQNSNFSAAEKKAAPFVPAEKIEEQAPVEETVVAISESENSIIPETPVVLPVPDPVVAFAKLNGARWDLPCSAAPAGTGCATASPISSTVEMEGEADKQYNVKVRIRGVVEPMIYKDGMSSTIDPRFYIGGAPNNPHYNIYRLSIENPPQDYFLNQSDSVSSTTAVIDYTVEVVISGKSKVTLFADAQNGSSIANIAGHTVPDLITPPELLSGQFVQMDVVSVTIKE